MLDFPGSELYRDKSLSRMERWYCLLFGLPIVDLHNFLPVTFFVVATGTLYVLYIFSTLHRFSNISAILLTTTVFVFLIGLAFEQISQMQSRNR